jgi:hypothetical protein
MAALTLITLAPVGCGVFEELTAENVFLRLSGPAGTQVQVVYSTEFSAGVNEVGVTQVRLFLADTVMHTLPVDTVIDIRENRQAFFEVFPFGVESAQLDIHVDVDGRTQLEESGQIFAAEPWRYVYGFNRQFTRDVDLVL